MMTHLLIYFGYVYDANLFVKYGSQIEDKYIESFPLLYTAKKVKEEYSKDIQGATKEEKVNYFFATGSYEDLMKEALKHVQTLIEINNESASEYKNVGYEFRKSFFDALHLDTLSNVKKIQEMYD